MGLKHKNRTRGDCVVFFTLQITLILIHQLKPGFSYKTSVEDRVSALEVGDCILSGLSVATHIENPKDVL